MASVTTTNVGSQVVHTESFMGVQGNKEILSIQYLRALAALSVVVHHASIALLPNSQSLVPFQAGAAGVDLFFVISGFIMYYTTARRAVLPTDFYLRRLIRIFPLYFTASTLAFLIARVAPGLVRTFSPNPYDYLRSILFIPYYNTTTKAEHWIVPLVRPEVGQGWTLNYEIFFYLLFGLCLAMPRRFRTQSLVAVLLLLTTLGILFKPAGAILATYTDPLLLEFLLGIALGHFLIHNVRTSLKLSGSLLLILGAAASVIVQFYDPHLLPRVIGYGLPAAGVVGAALWLERAKLVPRWPFLLLLGDASYSLYILHGFVLATFRRACAQFFNVNLVTTHIVFLIVSALAAEAIGILVFKYAERPVTTALTAALRRKKEGRKNSATPASEIAS
jgi:peptidoglycan/LPS O-acetylase OafA/YrhL